MSSLPPTETMSYLLCDVAPGLSIDARAEPRGDGPVVVCIGEKLLVRGSALPLWSEVESIFGALDGQHHRTLGTFHGSPIRLVVVDALDVVPAELRLERPRNLMFLFAEDQPQLALALVAQQYGHFVRTHRFCGICGDRTVAKVGEHAMRCERCARDIYPHVAPCMITLVHDGPRILLSRAPRFPKGMYGLSAGFVEPGETLEQCVHREVREETALSVKNLKYRGSQPWPMPSQLMVGFSAEYAGGDLVVDTNELEEAAWFNVDALPALPPPVSIARHLIDAYVAELKS